ncbi:polar amino acid transport system substrate-binding protein [Oxalobacteraceae bacterium GrIS 1.11]
MAMKMLVTFVGFAAALSGASAANLTITTEHSPPASMQEGQQIVGRETDKIREILARAAIGYKIDILPWKRAYNTALSQVDTCVYSTSRTPEREKLFKWVGPTDEADWIFVGRVDHTFKLNTLEDARELRIGTYNGDAREEFLRARGFHVDSVLNDFANPQKLLLNRIDLWAVGMRPGSTALTNYPWSERIAPLLTFKHIKVYLACNPAVPDLLIEQMNAALATMRRDGAITRIERKYEHWNERK